MRQFLQKLPLAAEFAIVILGAFGVFMLATFRTLVEKTGAGDAGATAWHSNDQLIAVIAYELPLGAAVFAFLRLRGWTLERLGIRISAVETLVGFGLAFFAELACYVPLFAVALASPEAIKAMTSAHPTAGGFGLATVIIASIVNPIFEETFV